MTVISREVVLRCLVYVIRPAVGFCLRHSLKLQDLIEAAKHAFVLQAKKEIEKRRKRPNVSVVSVISGIHRRDVDRLFDGELSYDYSKDVATRVMGLWLDDPRFCDAHGSPKHLSCIGEDSEFHQLVKCVSSDLNAASVRFDLERVGAAIRTQDDKLCLLAASYIPKGNVQDGFTILAKDAHDLVQAVSDIVLYERNPAHLHVRTEYDKIRIERVEEVRRMLLKEGLALHRRAREMLAAADLDVTPLKRGEQVQGVARVVLGSFSFVEPLDTPIDTVGQPAEEKNSRKARDPLKPRETPNAKSRERIKPRRSSSRKVKSNR